MMTLGIRTISSMAVILGITYQTSALALTDYLATGTFYADSLEVIQYDNDTGDETLIDAFLDSQPLPLPSSTFTLAFTVDESIDGRVPLFSPTAFFSGAISDVSLDINGTNIFSIPTELATVGQFPGDFQGLFSASWGWSLFPESGPLPLAEIFAFDNDTFELLGSALAQGFSFRLVDSSRQIYSGNGTSFLDMITLDLNDFDGASLELFWYNDFVEEPDFGEEPPEINYTVFATIDHLTNLSAVPLPGGIWLLLSALSGFVVVTRRNLEC